MGLLDKIKDFGGSLKYGSDLIDQAENIIGVDKEDMNDSQRKKFRQILEDLYQDKQQNKEPPKFLQKRSWPQKQLALRATG